MSIELKLLVWSAALAFVQMLAEATGAFLQVGLPKLAGNREGLPPMVGWAGRAERAHRNMLANLVLFAALVLVAQAAGKANAMTALGAQLFFWARLVYAGVYLAGIPWVRTGVWAVSVVGLVLIFLQLV
ncbi:MAG: MAPEG family protein [Proteobacteria bacterium]|nr:MAPEG family protein [Pseudomonadota bacterium]